MAAPAEVREVVSAEVGMPAAAASDVVAAGLVEPQARLLLRLGVAPGWLSDLEREMCGCAWSQARLMWDVLTRQFEAQLIHTALELTRGRRIEAAQKLGLGTNTITRKIQELGMDE